MAEGPGVDVLEGDLQAEKEPKHTAEMRQMWRAEAERAAEYFSAIPGFDPVAPGVRATSSFQPPPVEPDAAAHNPARAEAPAASAPEPEVSGEAAATADVEAEAEAEAPKDRLPRHKLLSRLRHPLGGHPHTEPAPPAVAEAPGPAEGTEPEPAEAPPKKSPAIRFRSSF
jgi:hypothetical protein